jgi:hypothetical protein
MEFLDITGLRVALVEARPVNREGVDLGLHHSFASKTVENEHHY